MQYTTKQQYWFDHITTAKQSKQTMSAYAAQHNLCVKSLYSWTWQLKQLSQSATKKENPFIKISTPKVPSEKIAVASVNVTLPNGISLKIQQLTPETLNMLLSL